LDDDAGNQARVLDANACVAADLPCVLCGYNLRTLSEDAVCPECARAVRDSLRAQYLRHAPPDWVTRLAEGARALLVAGVLTFAIPLVLGALLLVPSDVTAGIAALTVVPGLAVIAVAVLGGLLTITERNPALRDCPEGARARRVVRWSMAAVIPVWFLSGISSGLLRPSIPVEVALLLLSFGAALVLPLSICWHVADLMRLIPRKDLARYAHCQFWALLGVGVVFVAGLALEFASPRAMEPVGDTLMTIAAIALIPTAIAAFVLIILVDRALAEEARNAKRRGGAT